MRVFFVWWTACQWPGQRICSIKTRVGILLVREQDGCEEMNCSSSWHTVTEFLCRGSGIASLRPAATSSEVFPSGGHSTSLAHL